VLAAIERGDVLDDIVHPNFTRYPHQRIMVVRIGEYAFLVAFLEGMIVLRKSSEETLVLILLEVAYFFLDSTELF